MRRTTLVPLVVLLAALAIGASPILAQAGAVEASGRVLDRDGNPIQDAVITFTPKIANPISYTGKTNKKGRYFIAGMYNPQGEQWSFTIEAEGWAPVEMAVESRNVNRVLVIGPETKKLGPGTQQWEIPIRPLGSAKVDFTMAPAEEIQAQIQAEQQAAAVAAGEAPAAPPQKDPWDEALTLAGAGDLEGSLPLFRKAIDDEPDDAQRRSTMAKVLYQLGRLDEAEEQAQAAIERDDSDVATRMVLYSIYMSDGDLMRAREVLEQAREVAPDDTRVLKQLAFVAGETGDTAGQIEAWEAVVAANPDDTEAWMSLGDLYAKSGEMTKSTQAYERVTELDPSGAHQIFYNIGALIMNDPNRSEAETRKAIQAFRKAIEIKPDYAQAHKQLAFALLNVGDRAGAKQALQNYLKSAPNAPDAAQMKALVQTLEK